MHPRSRPHEWQPIEEVPLNGGPDPASHVDSFLTPTTRFFVRNHGNIPVVELVDWRLTIAGLVQRPATMTMADLLRRHSIVRRPTTIQCAGFRRLELSAP